MNHEHIFLGSCLLEPTLIDAAIESGLKREAFNDLNLQQIWNLLLTARTCGKLTDWESIFLDLRRLEKNEMEFYALSMELSACSTVPTSLNGKKTLGMILEAHTLKQLEHGLSLTLSQIKAGASLEDVKPSVDALEPLLRPSVATEHSLPEVVADARKWAENEAAGAPCEDVVVETGLPAFDRDAGGIMPHEYVILGARTSHGKSSMSNQIAGHNLDRGLRVVVFTLETSARAVIMQIAAQRTGVNLRRFRDEMKPKQDAFLAELERIKGQSLLVFDKDLTLDRIESRGRLLAASFKPHLVIIDYLGLIKTKGDGAYERTTTLSKAMIPLKKTLGCAMIVDAQLNRGNEKEDRPPTRTDFRDTGSIEEDAHRIICLHRPAKDESGMAQVYGRNVYHSEIYQLKLRDGPLAQGRLDFFSGCTKFVEK